MSANTGLLREQRRERQRHLRARLQGLIDRRQVTVRMVAKMALAAAEELGRPFSAIDSAHSSVRNFLGLRKPWVDNGDFPVTEEWVERAIELAVVRLEGGNGASPLVVLSLEKSLSEQLFEIACELEDRGL